MVKSGRAVSHSFDPATDFCLHCGISAMRVLEDGVWECPATENVVAISHLLAAKRFQRLISVRG